MAYRRGHCKDNRKVTRKAQSWYDVHALENLARIEQERGRALAMTRANLPYAAQDRQDVRVTLAPEQRA